MNAIIALCHFCDFHGPRTLFCTQAFKYSNSSNQDEYSAINLAESAPPQSLSPEFKSTNKNDIINLESVNATCKACRAFDKNFHHYISYDSDLPVTSINNSNNNINDSSSSTNICYISQSAPTDSEVFALVRKACLRTLHCEVFEDPIYFDDDKNGSVIGYEFNIKDSEARGFQRSYSLIIIMKDRIYLQHLWSFLSQQMSIIASNIKLEAERKFEKDIRPNNRTENDLQNCQLNQRHPGLCAKPKSSSSNVNKQVRGLIELTDDKMIFAKLHMWFTWILRMSACQISEEFLHGPLTEDLQVKMEREELKEFYNDFNEKFNKNIFNNNENTDILNYGFKIENLRQLLKFVGYDKFHLLAYNTVIGNQVIVRGKCETLISSIIRTLEELIPLGCCKSVYYSNEYIKSYECKLLGISNKVTPFVSQSDLDSDNEFENLNIYTDLDGFIFADVVQKDDSSCSSSTDSNTYSINSYNSMFDISIKTNLDNISQIPSILTKIEGFLLNESLNDSSISLLIKLAKEEWLNKTKVFYKYIQSPSAKTSFDTETVLKMLNLSKNDELALKFWQAGLSNECKYQIRSC